VWISFCDETLSNFIKTKHPKEGGEQGTKGKDPHLYKKRELVHYFYHILIENVGKISSLVI